MRPSVDHRPAILKAAARLFANKPFHEVLMDEVAAEAGVSKGTVYRFYPDKKELQAAIVLEWMDAVRGEVRAAARARGGCAMRLRKMVERIAEHFRRQIDFCLVMQKVEHNVNLLRRPEFLARRQAIRDLFADVIREGQARRELRGIDPIAAADMVLGMTRGQILFGPQRRSLGDVVELTMGVFLDGVRIGRRRIRNP